MLANRRFVLGAERERSSSTSRSKYFVRSSPESAARRSRAATLSDGMRNETTCVIHICLQQDTDLVNWGLAAALLRNYRWVVTPIWRHIWSTGQVEQCGRMPLQVCL